MVVSHHVVAGNCTHKKQNRCKNIKEKASDDIEYDEDEKILMEACEKFHGQVVIPCTACRYCCEGCPVQINIPEYLKVYNAGKVEGQ